MTTNLIESIRQLTTLTPILNEVTNKASAVVARVEQFLNDECSLGVPCWTLVEDSASDNGGPILAIGYLRIGGKFRISVITAYGHPNCEWDNIKEVAWSEAPRDQKLQTFNKLPDLLAELHKSVERAIERASETSKTVDEILTALNDERPIKVQPSDVPIPSPVYIHSTSSSKPMGH